MSKDESLGKCAVCKTDDTVALYPLLPDSPAFCSKHHNPKDAGRFGCDFTGPDDFDIPVPDEEAFGLHNLFDDIPMRLIVPRKDLYEKLRDYTSEQFKHWRKKFRWIDINGKKHKLKDIDDPYLCNIMNWLQRKEDRKSYINSGLMKFLQDEAAWRLEQDK